MPFPSKAVLFAAVLAVLSLVGCSGTAIVSKPVLPLATPYMEPQFTPQVEFAYNVFQGKTILHPAPVQTGQVHLELWYADDRVWERTWLDLGNPDSDLARKMFVGLSGFDGVDVAFIDDTEAAKFRRRLCGEHWGQQTHGSTPIQGITLPLMPEQAISEVPSDWSTKNLLAFRKELGYWQSSPDFEIKAEQPTTVYSVQGGRRADGSLYLHRLDVKLPELRGASMAQYKTGGVGKEYHRMLAPETKIDHFALASLHLPANVVMLVRIPCKREGLNQKAIGPITYGMRKNIETGSVLLMISHQKLSTAVHGTIVE